MDATLEMEVFDHVCDRLWLRGWMRDRDGDIGAWTSRWTVDATGGGFLYRVSRYGRQSRSRTAPSVGVFNTVALLIWYACIEEDLPAYLGKCTTCSTIYGGRQRNAIVNDLLDHPGEWRCYVPDRNRQRAALAMARDGLLDRLDDHAVRFQLACCRGTGLTRVEAAELVHAHTLRDAGATERLTVRADELQAEGLPIGRWISEWLAGLDGWAPEALAWLRSR